jgi:membrane-associated phospholipid phosphatase
MMDPDRPLPHTDRMAVVPDRRPRAGLRPTAAMLWFAGTGLVLVVGSALAASSGRVGGVERAVFEAVNGLPEFLRWPMWVFQLLGLVGLPAVVAVVALFWRRIRLAIGLVALIPLKLLVEKEVVKELVHRERPGRTEPAAILRDVPSAGNSFPSGHAIIAFGIATLLTPYLGRRGRVLVWTLAALNGVARVYLGAHNPLDVVCGAGLGLVLGAVLTWVLGTSGRKAARTEATT